MLYACWGPEAALTCPDSRPFAPTIGLPPSEAGRACTPFQHWRSLMRIIHFSPGAAQPFRAVPARAPKFVAWGFTIDTALAVPEAAAHR